MFDVLQVPDNGFIGSVSISVVVLFGKAKPNGSLVPGLCVFTRH